MIIWRYCVNVTTSYERVLVPTSLKMRECCGAKSLTFSTVGLREFLRICTRYATDGRVPNLGAECDQFLFVRGIKALRRDRIDKNTSIEAAPPEDNCGPDVRVLGEQNLCHESVRVAQDPTKRRQ